MVITNCAKRKRTKRHRTVVSFTLDPHIVASLKKEMVRLEETNFSSFVDGIFDCFLRETCEGCPAYEELSDEEKDKITGKVGAGKWITNEETESG